MARIQEYEMLKTLPLQDVENLWRWHQVCDDWFRYYCWEWRNSTPRFSDLYKHWEGKPAPCPKPDDGTNYDIEDLCVYCGEYIPPAVKVVDRGDPLHPGCQLCRDYDEREYDYGY